MPSTIVQAGTGTPNSRLWRILGRTRLPSALHNRPQSFEEQHGQRVEGTQTPRHQFPAGVCLSRASLPATAGAFDFRTRPWAQETTLNVWWEPVEGATQYKLIYRAFSDPWDSAQSLTVDGDVTKTVVADLEQQTTYQFKLIAVIGGEETPPSVETSANTLQSDCTPKGQRTCLIQ